MYCDQNHHKNDFWGWGATGMDIPEQTDDISSEVSEGGSAMHENSWNFKCD